MVSSVKKTAAVEELHQGHNSDNLKYSLNTKNIIQA